MGAVFLGLLSKLGETSSKSSFYNIVGLGSAALPSKSP